MRKCHVCGREVDDKTYICPDCGAEIVGSTGGLTLKANEESQKKKPSSSLGMTVSTGSGLTDILRADDDTDDVYGSLPTPVGYDLTDYESNRKAKAKPGKIIFRLVLIALLAFALYSLITKLLMKRDGPASYEEAIDTYIEAINNHDLDKMTVVTPAFFTDQRGEATRALESLKDVHIDEYSIVDKYFLNSTEKSSLQDSIKYATTRTANMSEVVNIRLQVTGDSLGQFASMSGAKTGEVIVQIVEIRDSWYVLLDKYEEVKFN